MRMRFINKKTQEKRPQSVKKIVNVETKEEKKVENIKIEKNEKPVEIAIVKPVVEEIKNDVVVETTKKKTTKSKKNNKSNEDLIENETQS